MCPVAIPCCHMEGMSVAHRCMLHACWRRGQAAAEAHQHGRFGLPSDVHAVRCCLLLSHAIMLLEALAWSARHSQGQCVHCCSPHLGRAHA